MNYTYSIIIPHYNTPELLVRCLNSIPICEDIQVIVVDDCSPDADTYLNRFPEFSRLYLEWYSTTRGGCAGRARNVGLEHATGKWILFIDSDDYFTPNFESIIEKYVDLEYDVIHFKEDSFIEGTDTQSNRHEDKNRGIDMYLEGKINLREAALWHTAVVSLMISREYIEKNLIRFDEVLIAEDIMFAAKLACLTDRILISDEVLYMVSDRDNGLHRTEKKNLERYVQMNKIQLQLVRYITKFGVTRQKPCMLKAIQNSYYPYGFSGVIKTLKMVLGEHALFYGFGEYLKRKIRK